MISYILSTLTLVSDLSERTMVKCLTENRDFDSLAFVPSDSKKGGTNRKVPLPIIGLNYFNPNRRLTLGPA